MALEGSIQTFELAEIFQMIQRQKKDGILALAKGKEGVLVQFKEGRIIKASGAEEEDDLLNLLLKAEQINLKDVKVALEEQKRVKQPLSEVMISLDIMAPHQLKRLTRLHTEEIIFQLFEWKSGKYKFEQKNISYNVDFVEPMSIEFTLMEGVRRMDEWPLLLKKIPSLQVTFEIAVDFSSQSNKKSDQKTDDETSFESLENLAGSDEEEEGGEEEAWLIKQVQQERNVQEMIDMAEMGAFYIYKGLVDLLSQGKIKKKGGHEVKVASTSLSIKDIERREKTIKFISGSLVIGSTLFLLFLAYPSVRSTLLSANQSIQEIQKLATWNEIDIIRHHLEIYYLRKGNYPTSLEELFSSEEIQRSEVDLGSWRYRPISDTGTEFHLELK